MTRGGKIINGAEKDRSGYGHGGRCRTGQSSGLTQGDKPNALGHHVGSTWGEIWLLPPLA